MCGALRSHTPTRADWFGRGMVPPKINRVRGKTKEQLAWVGEGEWFREGDTLYFLPHPSAQTCAPPEGAVEVNVARHPDARGRPVLVEALVQGHAVAATNSPGSTRGDWTS